MKSPRPPKRDYVTIIELARIVDRHKSAVITAVRKYGIPLIEVREDGWHAQYAVSTADAEAFLAARDADGFARHKTTK
jgi:hypothetical protein